MRLRRLDGKVSPYLYIAPFFLALRRLRALPAALHGLGLAHRPEPARPGHRTSSGSHNYTALLHDSYFWNAVENTLGIWLISTVPQLLLALVLAHVLNTKLRGRTFFRMGVLLPQVTSLVAVALIFTQLFSHDYGLINYVLGQFGIGKVDWEAGRLLVLDRPVGDGDLALDGLQRAHLPRRDAGDPGRPVRGGRDRRRAAAGGSSST